MNINIENQKLPDIYMSRGRQCYLDSVRGKLVYITPEETVRQRMISYLLYELHVPKEMITVEARLSEYGIRSKRRADIIVHGKNEDGTRYPILVIECKAPDVYLDEKTHTQVFDYCDELGADYAVVVNGYEWFCYKYDANKQRYDEISRLPLYEEILTGKYELRDLGTKPKRIPFENYENFLKEEFESYSEDYYGTDISKSTPMPLAKAALNLCEALLDIDHKMPEGQYGLFRLVQDYGIRMLSYGNAGGSFYGPYRSFLIERNKSMEFVSFSFSTYVNMDKPNVVKTCLCVAHDDEKETHHALQLVFENNVQVIGDEVRFYHHGRIAVGHRGSGKVDELRMFVEEKYPEIIAGKRFYMGSLVNDRQWNIDEPDVIKLLERLITYALIRDEYRDFVKTNL